MTKFSSSRTLGFRHFVPYLVPYFGGFVHGRKFGNVGIFVKQGWTLYLLTKFVLAREWDFLSQEYGHFVHS